VSELTHYPFDTRDNSAPYRQDPQDAKIADLRAMEARSVAAERMRAEYAGMVSEVADIARRIGPAAMPEWIRGKLDEIVSRHRRWNAALATPADAGEREE
jgi:hypothetical protein